MSVSRLSISVPAEIEKTIRTAAEAAGLPVSVWLAQVAERAGAEQAAIADGLAAVAEFETEYGALTDAERAEARQILIDTGVIPSQRDGARRGGSIPPVRNTIRCAPAALRARADMVGGVYVYHRAGARCS